MCVGETEEKVGGRWRGEGGKGERERERQRQAEREYDARKFYIEGKMRRTCTREDDQRRVTRRG